MKKTIAFIIASEGYQPIEYSIPYTMLTSDGIQVLTVSDKPKVAIAKDGTTTTVDATLEEIHSSDLHGLFVIGGPGALEHLNTERLHILLQEMATLKKPIGAICISPRILAEAGVLKGKLATGWNEDNELPDILKEYQATYVSDDVVIDGTVITASGPHAAQSFALGILKLLGQ